MAPRKRREFLDRVGMIELFEEALPIFLANRRAHPNHDRETCFHETIEELRAAYQARETDTRRTPGA